MADYYPLIARAVAGLDKNTGEARRALYERARTALVTQLRGTTPPLSESEITRERLALEEAIRKVEAEAAKRGRGDGSRPAERPRPDAAPPAPPPPAAPRPEEPVDHGPPEAPEHGPPKPEAAAPRPAPPPRSRSRASLRDEGLKGFRDVVAEAEELGNATAQASKSAREAFAAVPSPSAEVERIEPRMEPEGLRGPARGEGPPAPAPVLEAPGEPPPHGPGRARPSVLEPEGSIRPPRSYYGLIRALIVVLVIAGLAGLVYWQRGTIAGLYASLRGPATPPATQEPAAPASRQKIPDRAPGTQSGTQPGQPIAPVAQRVVLYEEDTNDPQGKRYVGSAVWKLETVSPGPGLAPEMAVKAEIEVPERRLTATFSIRRNTDQALPASHTIEVTFALPADFEAGGIQNVPGVLMKQAEATRGVPLAGLAVKVTTGFFLIGLSAVETDVQRNVQLLKERSWFDIPIVYNNGRRAILAIEKGNPGERAFEEAFRAWGN